MTDLAAALRAVNALKNERIIVEYAVAGAMAQVFWVEAVATYDLDVLVTFPPSESLLVSLAPIYTWAEKQGYETTGEHVVIGGMPVQFLPSSGALTDEAIARAATFDFNGVPVRVIRPEFLIAIYLSGSARTKQRRERAATLRDSPSIDSALLGDLIERYHLEF